MSGGRWDYLQFRLDERAEYAGSIWTLMGHIEHVLDWGLSGDTCRDCARIQVSKALETYFDLGATSVEEAVERLRNPEPSDQCADCGGREHRHLCTTCEPAHTWKCGLLSRECPMKRNLKCPEKHPEIKSVVDDEIRRNR